LGWIDESEASIRQHDQQFGVRREKKRWPVETTRKVWPLDRCRSNGLRNSIPQLLQCLDSHQVNIDYPVKRVKIGGTVKNANRAC
jgi:hypothetical protein